MKNNLKGQNDLSGTMEGMEKLARINHYLNRVKDPLDQQVENQALLIRARGRVVCDLIAKGELDEDAQKGVVNLFSKVLNWIKLPPTPDVERDMAFRDKHGD